MDLIWSILGALLSKVAVDDLKAWMPWLVKRLIDWSVAKAPESYRSQLNEEWRAEVNEIPGDIGKIIFAACLLLAGRRVPLAPVGIEIVEAPPTQAPEIFSTVRLAAAMDAILVRHQQTNVAATMDAILVHNLHRQTNFAALAAAASFTDVSSGTTLTHHSHCIRAQVLGGPNHP